MNDIKLALLKKLAREIDETEEIETAVKGTDDIFIFFLGDQISLDHEILEYAREHYKNKLYKLKKEFEEA
ncbi:MAG: hypothetical protein J6Y64_06260 [Ruminococcus sp.]|nr:hypothetical protein [Ruminococcus sp.]